MINREELKNLAKKQIDGNIGILFLCCLIISVLIAIGTSVVLGAFILTPPLSLSLVMIFQNLAKGKKPEVEKIFEGFKDKGFERSIILFVLVYVYTFLWSLLFVIPGIIKGLSYSMSLYILAENPDMTASEAIEESKRIMDGHKWELFVLELSFIGWYLLASLTFGIVLVYLIPYQRMTLVNFYNKIKKPKAVAEKEIKVEK